MIFATILKGDLGASVEVFREQFKVMLEKAKQDCVVKFICSIHFIFLIFLYILVLFVRTSVIKGFFIFERFLRRRIVMIARSNSPHES